MTGILVLESVPSRGLESYQEFLGKLPDGVPDAAAKGALRPPL